MLHFGVVDVEVLPELGLLFEEPEVPDAPAPLLLVSGLPELPPLDAPAPDWPDDVAPELDAPVPDTPLPAPPLPLPGRIADGIEPLAPL